MKIERVDDIPLLIATFEKSHLRNLINEHFPDHGNWRGADGGTVLISFLTYVLSMSDHRLSHVESWGADRIETLRHCLDTPALSSKDLTDDKLGLLLDRLSDKDKWTAFEAAHNKKMINVYSLGLEDQPVRLDSFITQSHRLPGEDFKLGFSKQHRDDLPQLKSMVATLDPLAMPLYSVTVSGNTSDDDLYLPVINELTEKLPLKNQLFVGDSKMGNTKIRHYLQSQGHYYLAPLNRKQCLQTEVVKYLDQKPEVLTTLWDNSGKEPQIKAEAFEIAYLMSDDESKDSWQERRILVYSPAYAKQLKAKHDDKIKKTQQALDLILVAQKGRRVPKNRAQLDVKVDKVLSKYQMHKYFDIKVSEQIEERHIQRHLDRPERTELISHFTLECTVNEAASEEYVKKAGWQIYATNAPATLLNTKQAVSCYRNEYKIEHKFNELLNKITALMPVYLKKPNRIKSLIQLLLLGLKYVSAIEFQVRKKLEVTGQKLNNIYPGNPGRSTDKPTFKMLLKVFGNISLALIKGEQKKVSQITELDPIHLKILDLMGLEKETYYSFYKCVPSNLVFSET